MSRFQVILLASKNSFDNKTIYSESESGQGEQRERRSRRKEHSALCLRLMQLFPRVSPGMRRWQDRVAPSSGTPLGPRHVAALQQLRGGPDHRWRARLLPRPHPAHGQRRAGRPRPGRLHRPAARPGRPPPHARPTHPASQRSSGSGWTAPPARWPGSSTSSRPASSRVPQGHGPARGGAQRGRRPPLASSRVVSALSSYSPDRAGGSFSAFSWRRVRAMRRLWRMRTHRPRRRR